MAKRRRKKKVYWKVIKNEEGRLIVCGMEEIYSEYTNEEIADLMKSVDGVDVIEGFVAEVDKNGNATKFGIPVLA